MNPMAADKEMRMELLSVGPFCMIDGEERALDYDNPDPETGMAPPKVDRLGDPLYKQVPAYCSPNASRTQRSGVPDIKYMLRPDRRYCENKFARQRLSAESGDSIEMCRSNLTRRIEQCDISCDACNAQCLSKVVRDVTSIGKCTFTLNIPGVVQALHSSDVGLDIASRWGAVRTEGRPAQPTASWEEKYRTIIQNNIDTPIAPRNCKLSTQTTTPANSLPLARPFPVRSNFLPQASPRIVRGCVRAAARRGRVLRGAQGVPRAMRHRP